MRPWIVLATGMMFGVLASCQMEAAWNIDAPKGESLGRVTRALLLAVEAQDAAAQQALDAIGKATIPGGYDRANLDAARRSQQRLRTKAQLVDTRIEQARLSGDLYFQMWSEEIGTYTDSQLAKEAARQRKGVMKRYEAAVEAVEAAKHAMEPMLTYLDDRILSIQHAYAANVEAPEPRSTEVIAGMMMTKTREAREACEVFQREIPEEMRLR